MRTWEAGVYGTQRSVHRSENHSFPRPHPKMILASPLQNHKYLLSMHPFYSHFCTFAFIVPLSSIYPVSIVFPLYLLHIPLFSLALFPKWPLIFPNQREGEGRAYFSTDTSLCWYLNRTPTSGINFRSLMNKFYRNLFKILFFSISFLSPFFFKVFSFPRSP